MNKFLATSAEEWGVPFRTAAWILGLPLAGALLVAAARLNKDLYRFCWRKMGRSSGASLFSFLWHTSPGPGWPSNAFKPGTEGNVALRGFRAGDVFHCRRGDCLGPTVAGPGNAQCAQRNQSSRRDHTAQHSRGSGEGGLGDDAGWHVRCGSVFPKPEVPD